MLHNSKQRNIIHDIGDECSFTLTDTERDTLKKRIDDLPDLDLHQMDNDDFFVQIELAKRFLPVRLISELIRFRVNPNNYGTLLIHNLPTDADLPPTPNDGKHSLAKTSSISEYNLLLVLMYLGEPIAYADVKEGEIIHNICPIQGHEEQQKNSGSIFFDFHTDFTYHPYKADCFGLFCLRSDHDHIVRTFTASIRQALPKLPDTIIPLLQEPYYRSHLPFPLSKTTYVEAYSPLVPILSSNISYPDLCIDFYTMEAIRPDAQLALDLLKAALMDVVVGSVLLPGDLMLVDNRMVAHGRTAFAPRYDGKDRWLQRLCTIQDFQRSKTLRQPGSHICMKYDEYQRDEFDMPLLQNNPDQTTE